MKIEQQAENSFEHLSNRDIDTSAEQITASSVTAKRGWLLKADAGNSGIIYIGASDVTAGTTDATDGYPLSAGESEFFPVEDLSTLYGIGSATNQVIYAFGA